MKLATDQEVPHHENRTESVLLSSTESGVADETVYAFLDTYHAHTLYIEVTFFFGVVVCLSI
jgi:hypothetical protein